jgi:hypothetical protein
MPGFLKLDENILTSSLWSQPADVLVFLTACLMARPIETKHPMPQIDVRELRETGWVVPPGRYGWVDAAGSGIVRASRVPEDHAWQSLRRLGEPDPHSRSTAFDGRRLVRVDGGYVVLNFARYRDVDYTAAERMRRYRRNVTRNVTANDRNVAQAEAEAEAEYRTEAEAEMDGWMDGTASDQQQNGEGNGTVVPGPSTERAGDVARRILRRTRR